MTGVWDSNSNNKRVAAEMLAASEVGKQQGARRIDIEVHSCSMCPYSKEAFDQMHFECQQTGKHICEAREGSLKSIGIHKDCPLEML